MADRFGILLLSDAPDSVDHISAHLYDQFSFIRIAHVHDPAGLAGTLDRGNFDLIIVVHPLGWTDGLAIPRALKQRWSHCSLVVISNATMVEAIVEPPEDVDDLLSDSPADLRRLCSVVRRGVALHEQRREAQREIEASFRVVFESAMDAMLIADDDGNFVDVNASACRLAGRTREDILGRGVLDLIAPGFDPGEVWADFRRSGHKTGEASIVRSDGTIRDTDYTATADVVPGRHLIVIRDTTQRKRAEEALRDSEERFRAIFSNAAIGIVVADMDGRPVLANRAQQEMLGYTEQELRQMCFWEFTAPDDVPVEMEYFEAVRAGKLDHYVFEKRYIRKDGQTIWASIQVSTIPDSDGKPAYFLVTVENTSERKRAEEAQHQSEERFRVTFENAAIGMALVDIHGTIMESNPALHKMLGYASGELCGMSISSLTYPDDFIEEVDTVSALISGDADACSMEKRYVHKHGQLVWARTSISLVKSADGQPLFAVGLVEDISGSRRAEAEIAQHNHRLTLLNSVAGALSASLELSGMLGGLGAIFSREPSLPPGRILIYDNADDRLRLGVQWRVEEMEGEMGPESTLVAGSAYESVVHTENLGMVLGPAESGSIVVGSIDDSVWTGRVLLPLIADGELQGIMELANGTQIPMDEARQAFMKTLAQQIGLALKKSRLHEQACADRQQLQNLSRQLVHVQEDERRKLARELHDEVGGMLAALSISLQMLSRLAGGESLNRIEQAKDMVKNLTDQIHELSLNLRPALLDNAGLVAALLCYFRRFTDQTAIKVDFACPSQEIHLPPGVPICAFRVIQEALTNAARHARVGDVHVSLSVEGGELVVEVTDEGMGFDVGTASSSGTRIGLAGMRERVYTAGGTFTVTSKLGSGTTLRAVIPCIEKEGEKR